MPPAPASICIATFASITAPAVWVKPLASMSMRPWSDWNRPPAWVSEPAADSVTSPSACTVAPSETRRGAVAPLTATPMVPASAVTEAPGARTRFTVSTKSRLPLPADSPASGAAAVIAATWLGPVSDSWPPAEAARDGAMMVPTRLPSALTCTMSLSAERCTAPSVPAEASDSRVMLPPVDNAMVPEVASPVIPALCMVLPTLVRSPPAFTPTPCAPLKTDALWLNAPPAVSPAS
jgi:hypothetical protein